MNRLCSRLTNIFRRPAQSSYCSCFVQKRYKSDNYDFKPLTSKGSLFIHPANDVPYKNDDEWRKKYFHQIDDENFDFMEWVREGVMKMTNTYDVSPESFQRYIMKNKIIKIRTKQIIDSRAVDYLGVDLAVAHMVLGLGGAVKLVGSDRWLVKTKGQQSQLPITAVRVFQLDGIDLTGTHLMYEGLEYIVQLKQLKFLRLGRSPFLTDHCVSRLPQLAESLELLDLSHCPQLSSKAIATLWPMKKLRRLLLSGLPFMEDKELVCLMLEEKCPDLYIEGFDYLEPLSEGQRHAVLEAATAAADAGPTSATPLLQSESVTPSSEGEISTEEEEAEGDQVDLAQPKMIKR